MTTRLSDEERGGATRTKPAELVVRRQAPPVAVVLRENGTFPLPVTIGRPLTAKQRRRRMLMVLELLGENGDGPAAAEALRHLRWEEEMVRGRAPQRENAAPVGELRVLDTLSAPPGIPIPRPRRGAQSLVDSQRAGAE